MTRAIRCGLVGGALLFALPAWVRSEEPERLPNIIFLVADDLGYGELSCQNPDTDIRTPHIDRIAENGVRLTSGYVTAPFCAASRAGLITGRYQTRFGFEFNPIGPRNEEPGVGLPVGEATLPDLLRDKAGYTTALIGKWHLGGTAQFNPLRRGFDQFFGFLHEGHYYVPAPWNNHTTWLRRRSLPGGKLGRWTSGDGRLVHSTHMGSNEPDYDADNPILHNGQPVVERANLTEAFTREALAFIRDCGDERPYFLLLSYNAVHSPLQGADEYMRRFEHIDDVQRRIFAAMLAQLDDGVGRVLDEVRRSGQWENTLLVFLSDNGGPTRELTSSNLPLRGEKGQVYEGGLRVPFLLQWPGTLESGAVYDEACLSLDLFATAISAAEVRPHRSLDGVDLLPFLPKVEEEPEPPEITSSGEGSTGEGETSSSVASGEDGSKGDPLGEALASGDEDEDEATEETETASRGEGDAIVSQPHPDGLFWRTGTRHAFRKGEWKIVRHGRRARRGPDGEWELYHLARDIGETENLAESNPWMLEELIEDWEELDEAMVEPVF